jgi:adenosylcobinamide-phosphate synthase
MEAWWVGLEDGVTASGPNGMVPEATFAGALGVELGGINFYGGQPVEMPKMGYPIRPLELNDIRLAWRLMIFSSWATLVFAALLRYFISSIFP